MTRTLSPGVARLYRLEAVEADGSVQVATGVDPEDGSTVILLRVGLLVTALGVRAAGELGAALVQEAADVEVDASEVMPWTN